jgi:hypothetical protein
MTKWIAIEVPQIYQRETYYDVSSIRASQVPFCEPEQPFPTESYRKLDISECIDLITKKKYI